MNLYTEFLVAFMLVIAVGYFGLFAGNVKNESHL